MPSRGVVSVDVGHGRVGGAAAVLDQQVDASWAAAGGSAGSTPRSKRFDASVTSLWRRDERATVIGSKCAASMRTSVVDGVDLAGGAAHDAGDAERALAAVGDEQVLRVEGPLDVVEGRQGLSRPRAGAPRSSR